MAFSIDTGVKDITTLLFWRKCLAEAFGMMFFLLSVSLVCNPWSNSDTGKNDASSDNLEIGLGIGLSITTCAIMIGHVSGGHLNPAVSVGAIFAGRISILQGLFYIPSQVIGAVAGSGIAYALVPEPMRNISNLGAVGLGKNVTAAQGFGLELLFTFVLVFFVLSITDSKKQVETYAVVLGIGICIWVCHCLLVPMTGCGINPARSLAPAAIMGKWDNHWVYWVGPLVAAPLAAALYHFVFFAPEAPKVKDVAELEPMKEANGDSAI